MPFEDAFRDLYVLGIKPACEEAGYYCERLDEQIFEETMLERIYNQIAKADLVVADLTARNPNVFYETGYAHGLGQRVILLTRNTEDIPFDLKHHFHIVYSDSIADLKQRLRERALYYASHPSTSTRNPFDQLAILLNGELLNWQSKTVCVTASVQPPTDYHSEHAVRIVAAFHLLDGALDAEVDLDVRLITGANFVRSGWGYPTGGSQVYATITMPDGRVMHKPLDRVRVSAGDPDQVVFDLYRRTRPLEEDVEYPMTLRLIAAGLQWDVALQVYVKK
jgi:hypothetical protein